MNKPWDNEPTPTTDGESCRVVNWYKKYCTAGCIKIDILSVPMLFASNLERRMRAAERLLEHTIDWSRVDPLTPLSVSIKAHLEAAQKEDGR